MNDDDVSMKAQSRKQGTIFGPTSASIDAGDSSGDAGGVKDGRRKGWVARIARGGRG